MTNLELLSQERINALQKSFMPELNTAYAKGVSEFKQGTMFQEEKQMYIDSPNFEGWEVAKKQVTAYMSKAIDLAISVNSNYDVDAFDILNVITRIIPVDHSQNITNTLIYAIIDKLCSNKNVFNEGLEDLEETCNNLLESVFESKLDEHMTYFAIGRLNLNIYMSWSRVHTDLIAYMNTLSIDSYDNLLESVLDHFGNFSTYILNESNSNQTMAEEVPCW